MKTRYPRLARLRQHGSAFVERASLFFAMYIVTVSLFWFETGMLSKGLIFGLIAASLKTAIARGHARMFQQRCEPLVAPATLCDECSAEQAWRSEVEDSNDIETPELSWSVPAKVAQTCG